MLVSVPLKTTSFSLLELGLVPSQVCHVLTDGLIHSHGHAVVPTNQVQPMFIGLFQSFRLFRIQLFLADPDKTYDLCYKIRAIIITFLDAYASLQFGMSLTLSVTLPQRWNFRYISSIVTL